MPVTRPGLLALDGLELTAGGPQSTLPDDEQNQQRNQAGEFCDGKHRQKWLGHRSVTPRTPGEITWPSMADQPRRCEIAVRELYESDVAAYTAQMTGRQSRMRVASAVCSVLIVAWVGAAPARAAGGDGLPIPPAPSDFPTRRHHHFFWDDNSGSSYSVTSVHGAMAWILGLSTVLVPLVIGGLVVAFNLRNRRRRQPQTGFGGLETTGFAPPSFGTGVVAPSMSSPAYPPAGQTGAVVDGVPLGAWPTPDGVGKLKAGRRFGATGWLVLIGALVVAGTVAAGVLGTTMFNRGTSVGSAPGGATISTGGISVSGTPGANPGVSAGGPTGSVGVPTVTAAPGGQLSVSGIGENKTIACNDSQVDVSGFTNTVTITGHCASLTVSGGQNHVTVDAADTISASGFNNQVTFHSGSPQVDNAGDNVVQQG
jgi:hypothetical protein